MALPSARSFLRDAAGRYVALDGRMWRTLAALMSRPGFLTREYLDGRRRRYIRPARLFLVLSLLMFATMRIVVGVPELRDGAIVVGTGPDPANPGIVVEVDKAGAARPKDSGPGVGANVDRSGIVLPGLALTIDEDGKVEVAGPGPVASLVRQRIERFNALPPQERLEQALLGMLRYGPYAMFVLLPAFAFLLMALYAEPGRRYPWRPRRYAEHLVFAAHNHAFFFLAVTLAIVVPWAFARAALALWCLVYALWSMKTVYGGRWLGLLARGWALAVAYAVLFGFVTAGLVVAAIVVR